MEQRRWFEYYITLKTNNITTELPTRTVRTNSALGERAADAKDPRDPPSKSGNLLGTWAIRADMDAAGWMNWCAALGIPGRLATEYGRNLEHEGLVYILRSKIYYVTPL